jgi:hypothetical protein
MKRLAIYGMLIVVLTIAWAAAHYYSTELSAVLWHARHGFHAHIGDIRVRVPLAYEADDPHGLPWSSISRMPGRFSGPGGFIMFDFRRLPTPEDIEAGETLLRQRGFKIQVQRVKLAERPAVFAGRRGRCIEYSAEIGELQLGAAIDCRFDGDLSVQLIGSSNLRDDFYNIIQTAEPVKRKN